MKLKRVTAMAMTAVLALGMLAGCGKSDSEDTAKSDSGSKDTKQEADGDVTTITYWGWDTNWYEPMFEKFMEENPDIKIEATNVAYSDYFTKIQQAIASGSELPTMVQQSCTLIANYKELGVFEDLTSDPYNVDPNIFFDFIKDRAMTDDGQLIGIEQSVSPSAIAYKRDAYLFHSSGAVAEWLYFADSTELQTGDTVNFTEKMTPVMDTLVKMRDNKVVDTFENGTPQANATYADDKHLFYPCPNWAISYYIKANDPDGEGNWGLMMPATGGYSCGGCSVGITNTSTDAQKDAAWRFLKWAFLEQGGVDTAKEATDYYVPTKEFYEDASYASGADPFFAGQDVGGFLYGEIAQSIVIPTPSIYDQTVIDIRDLLANAVMSDSSLDTKALIDKGLEECANRITDSDVKVK